MNDFNKLNCRVSFLMNLVVASILLNFLTLFVILLWWNVGDTDPRPGAMAVSLSVFQILLAVALVGGFWLFRSHVAERAEDVAKAVAGPVAEVEAAERAELVARRIAEAAVAERVGNGEDTTQAQVDALGEDD
ncbi:hypothetical protein [Actibacterium sp. MT2.3-13A]|uniref:hypothetical protein n=1 Tax=Actibacterium sp. MT2.3-13A TaxID=2828332 RepID=UPI001BAC7DDF|nr:hypothetical protein [Actibacterium sp. MT2.3-13A]